MENINFKKGEFLIAICKGYDKNFIEQHAVYRQGYLFTYDGIDYGIFKGVYKSGYTEWSLTHINSGLNVCYANTRKGAIEKLIVNMSERVKKFESGKYYKKITDYPVYNDKKEVA